MQLFDGQHTPAAAADLLRANGVPVSAAAVEKFAAKLKAMGSASAPWASARCC